MFGQSVEEFDPSRWKQINPTAKEYMPFSAGSRTCHGIDKTLVESAYMLVRLARQFEVLGLGELGPYKATWVGISMKNANGCKVAFRIGDNQLSRGRQREGVFAQIEKKMKLNCLSIRGKA
jgi:cytochrome P450